MATTDLPSGTKPARAAPGRRSGARLNSRLAGALRRIRAWSAAETGRLALWAPVGVGAGAAVYFSLKSEPSFWLAPVALFLAAIAWSKNESARVFWAAVISLALGFLAADVRTELVDAPALAREAPPRDVVGRLIAVEEAPGQRRLVIAVRSIGKIAREDLPARIRVNWRGKEFDAAPGDMIALRAGLSPPPPPVAPGAFDFARHLYFQRIGAVGYAVTPPEVLPEEARPLWARGADAVESARVRLARRILEKAPGQGGAIVAAVVTGKRAAVNEASERALRDSGLAHLLAISGLHMGLATGLIFFSVRLGLAAIEPVALRYPIKKWAAAAALLSGFIYLLLSGGGWSARRAFIMTSIIFIAILADRRAFSLRNVAIAAAIILLTTPEAVMHPGFQMSFAAVTALIAAYEWASKRADPLRSFHWVARLRRYIVGIAATDTIAATATAPFSLYHFNRAALYGLPANIASVPLMGFWVMPAAIAALFLMPFGADGPLWRLAASGVDAILAAGGSVADKPGAVAVVAQWPPLALGVITLGGLWFCLQKAAWRLAGLAALPAAAVLIARAPPPSLFVAPDGENVAAVLTRNGEGGLALLNTRKDRFAAKVWKEYAGLDEERAPTVDLEDIAVCDRAGCVFELDGARVAVSRDPLGLAEDCARADLVIADYPVSDGDFSACKAEFIDRRSVWRRGAHAVWFDEDGAIRIRTSSDARGVRPWTNSSSE